MQQQHKRRPNAYWEDTILPAAVEIVLSYDSPVTLRQLFYRLVAAELIENKQTDYSQLSSRTAQARREGWFPALLDRGREIEQPHFFTSPEDARDYIKTRYRRDRTEGQEYAVYLGVEKATMIEQLSAWFGNTLGIPIIALRGYSSQTFTDDVVGHVNEDGREAVLIYAGDLDPSGEDIDRDFVERTGCWVDVLRVALSMNQVEEFGLPPAPGKSSDSRSAAFEAKHGRLIQVELEALDPNTLRDLYQGELDAYWDDDAYRVALAREAEERKILA
jgi:hypothetical protein